MFSLLKIVSVCVFLSAADAFAVKTLRFLQNSALKANIVDTAAGAGNFKTLITALTAAGLSDVLSGPGPFTVFAPSDEAFAKLPPDSLAALLSDVPTLKNILQFHVHAGLMNPTRNGKSLDTLLIGQDDFPKQLSIKVLNWEMTPFVVGGQETPSEVTKMGIKCDNGLIHEIDTVLLPYEGNRGPTVTFIGQGGITQTKTLQLSFYGSLEGTGFGVSGVTYADGKEAPPIRAGDTWKRGGNWDSEYYKKGN